MKSRKRLDGVRAVRAKPYCLNHGRSGDVDRGGRGSEKNNNRGKPGQAGRSGHRRKSRQAEPFLYQLAEQINQAHARGEGPKCGRLLAQAKRRIGPNWRCWVSEIADFDLEQADHYLAIRKFKEHWLDKHLDRKPRLTAEQQRCLARRWQRFGDVKARDALILDNLKLAAWRSARYKRSGHTLWPDLLSEGFSTLLKCADLYNPDDPRGASFRTYASKALKKEMGRLACQENALARQSLYLDAPSIRDDGGDGINRHDAIGAPDAAAQIGSAIVRGWLRHACNRAGLSERDIKVLALRYVAGLSAAEIARDWQVSRQRVNQIERRALDRLRRAA